MASDAPDQQTPPRRNTSPSAAELELKRRGRRRLIGAITLGLVALVVLPMIFDTEPRGAGGADRPGAKLPKQEIAVQIPPKEGLAPLPPPSAPPSVSVGAASTALSAPSASAAQPAGSVGASQPVEPAKPTTPATAPKSVPAVVATTAPPKAETKPDVKPEAKLETKPSPKVEPKVDAKPAAKPEVKPETKTANSGGSFFVQLGAFKDAANAKAISAKLAELKLPVATDSIAVSGGTVTRVRAGPFTTKSAADSALAQLKLAGIDGKLVTPGK